MKRRAGLAFAGVGAVVGASLVGCAGSDPSTMATARAPSLAALQATSPRFAGVLTQIGALRDRLARGDDAGAFADTERLLQEGVALVGAPMPHDVAVPDAMRYDEARAAFAERLQAVVHARDMRDTAALRGALEALEGTTRRWSDAHLGLAGESRV